MYTISVTKFNNIVRDIFNNEELLHMVGIAGEVFGVSRAKTALYFSIKDEESTLPCVAFDSSIFGDIKEGEQVVVHGSPNFYTKAGRFSFITNKIEKVGQGLLYQRFVELKNKLEAEGLFDQSHKKPIPASIKRVGVVTSRDGAVIQDIKNVTWRRNAGVEIVLYSTKVQGIDADKEIVQGINFFSEYDNVDVVIVARGGGSMEDLSAYNSEIVARATYNCKKPIISAVGHETDFTIIDFVSDLRAPTPSAAAELITRDREKESQTFNFLLKKLNRELNTYIADKTEEAGTVFDNFTLQIENYYNSRMDNLLTLSNRLSRKIDDLTTKENHNLELITNVLMRLDPRAVLRRGYARIEQDENGIESVKKVDKEKNIKVYLQDGCVEAKPINIMEEI